MSLVNMVQFYGDLAIILVSFHTEALFNISPVIYIHVVQYSNDRFYVNFWI